ncbi:MAG: tRNA dihydrouridine(20/20a) synthase DusA [Gammaproteobacteria bacterium]|nr:tRNA dihydrouridine(20/20a) synthase DusA [Gammaproteobacteria bacterium]
MHRVSVAPMLDCTDKHCRYLHRLLTRNAVLYSEMVTTQALIHGDSQRFLSFNPVEHPIVLQLGGSNAKEMARCARMAKDFGYDEVNINVGCPSDRVQSGQFGACLMAKPDLVAACISEIRSAVDLPVTVKTRIGIDALDSYSFLTDFVLAVADAGCGRLIVHARKAWLSGLSPKENREIPPLDYSRVYRLKQDFPHLHITINGGIADWPSAEGHLAQVDGVMLGREAYSNPYCLAEVDARFYREQARLRPSRHGVLEGYITYMETQRTAGVPLGRMARHALGLFQGVPGARAWRRHLSENMWKPGATTSVIEAAAQYVQCG